MSQRLFARWPARKSRRTASRTEACRHVVESLEQRTLLSTIWATTDSPPNISGHSNALATFGSGGWDLGLRFQSDSAGFVTGVRFYRGGTAHGGTDIGELWNSSGTLLASATFTNESDSGWQQVNFSSHVAISAHTTYTVSYHMTSTVGAYTDNQSSIYTLSQNLNNSGYAKTTGVLHALYSGNPATGNPVGNSMNANTANSSFPNTYNGLGPNYWVDVVFTALTAPTNLTASNVSATDVHLAWTDSAGDETGFKIERSTNGGSFSQIATTTGTGTTFDDTTVSAGTNYAYRVRATNSSGDSAYTNTASITTVPAAPTGLTATPVSATQINLAWTQSSGATGYVIQRSPDGSTGWTQVGTTNSGTAVTFSDTNLAGATTYYYRVYATDAGGNSANSSTASTRTRPTPPTVTASQNAQLVNLSWPSIGSATGYTIQRSTDGGATWSDLESSPITATSDADYDYRNGTSWRLQPNSSYQYRLKDTEVGPTYYYSTAVSVTTSNFVVFDGTDVPNKPNLAPYGLDGAEVLTQQFLQNSQYTNAPLNQANVTRYAGQAEANNQLFVIDLEDWTLSLDDAEGNKSVVKAQLTSLISAIKTAKQSYPTVQVGVWGLPVLDKFGLDEGVYGAWRDSADLWTGHDGSAPYDPSFDLVSHLDFLAPVSFVLGDPSRWNATAVSIQLPEARYMAQKNGGNLPIYSFVTPQQLSALDKYGNSMNGTFAPTDYYQLSLATVRSNAQANGVIIWASSNEGWYGPDEKAWWDQTTNFIGESAAGTLTAATNLVSSGAHLSWTNNAGSVDGWVIERSTTLNLSGQIVWNGVPTTGYTPLASAAQTPGPTANSTDGSFITFGDVTQWTDPSAKGNQTYYYRVAPFKATSSVSWNDATGGMGLNWSLLPSQVQVAAPNMDAYATTFPRRYSNTIGGSDYWNGVGFAASGTTTLEYDNTNFNPTSGAVAPSYFRATIDDAGAPITVQLFLDGTRRGPGTDGTSLGTLTMTPVVGTQNVDISLTPPGGINWAVPHDLFIVITTSGNGGSCTTFTFIPSTADFESPLNPGAIPATPQSWYLREDSDGVHLDIWQNVTPNAGFTNWSSQRVLADLYYFSVQGSSAGGDSITIDNRATLPQNGHIPFIPVCGIHVVWNGTTTPTASPPTNLKIFGSSGEKDVVQDFGTSILLNNQTWVFDDAPPGSQTPPPAFKFTYVPGTGTTALGVEPNQQVLLQTDGSSGIHVMNFSDVTLNYSAAGGALPNLVAPPSTNGQANRAVLVVSAMSLIENYNPSYQYGTIDLQNSDMILSNLEILPTTLEAPPLPAGVGEDLVRSVLSTAYDGGRWDGIGITSSVADSTIHGLGYLVNGHTYPTATSPFSWTPNMTFDGVTPPAGAVMIKYTSYGDTNLDGVVDSVDQSHLSASGTATYWANGQFNYQQGVVVGRFLFYNNSTYDANASDDAAVAKDKSALLPGGGRATFANLSSYSKGINGVMVDIANLANPSNLSASDFTFMVSTDGTNWTTGPTPTLLVRPYAGAFGSTRVELVWADGSILNEWLKVIVNADATTGRLAPDTSYFGNLVGESGDPGSPFSVTPADEDSARNDPHSFLNPALITDPNDFNRDGLVDAVDQGIARNNNGHTLPVITE